MINLIAFSNYGLGTIFILSFLHLFELKQLSFSKFNNYEFLELNEVDYIKKRFDSIKNHKTQLASDAAVTILL